MGLFLALIGGVGLHRLRASGPPRTPEDVGLRLPLASIPLARLNTVSPVLAESEEEAPRRPTGDDQWDIPACGGTMPRSDNCSSARLEPPRAIIIGDRFLPAEASAPWRQSLPACRTAAERLIDRCQHLSSIAAPHLPNDCLLVWRTCCHAGPASDGDGAIVRRAVSRRPAAGGRNDTSARPAHSDTLIKYLQSAKQEYRFTVVDIPALSEDSSAIRLAGSCDGVVLVVETERLRWEAVATAKQQLQRPNINILGVLLNKRRFPVPKWIYAAL
jgi:hypothetical protein